MSIDIYPKRLLSQDDRHLIIRIDWPEQYLGLEATISLYDLEHLLERRAIEVTGPVMDLVFQLGEAEAFGLELSIGSETAITACDRGSYQASYGFVSEFSCINTKEDEEILKFMLQTGTRNVQFYDWNYSPDTYRHQEGQRLYTDTMGKLIDLDRVRSLISHFRAHGIASLAYGAVYAATKQYLDSHPDQGLYGFDGSNVNLIDTFFIMNLEHPAWLERIIDQYTYSVDEVGFDGIHMDSYGYPKLARTEGPTPHRVDLAHGICELIRRWTARNTKSIFNNVGYWPVERTAQLPVAACYIEVWEPHVTYRHLLQLIERARGYGKPVILAAYLKSFKSSGVNMNTLLLLTAVTASAGASLLLSGQKDAILCEPYYSDHLTLSPNEKQTYIRIRSFVTRYAALLFDPSLEVTSETHLFCKDGEYTVTCTHQVGYEFTPGTLNITSRQNGELIVFSLICLIDQQDSLWDAPKIRSRSECTLTITIPAYSPSMNWFVTSCEKDQKAVPLSSCSLEGKSTVKLKVNEPWMLLYCRMGQ